MNDRSVVVDGRTTSLLDTGGDGPVVVVHDGDGSRLVALLAAEVAAPLGIRLLAPDRPGFWASDPATDDPLDAWPDVLLAVLDQLGIATSAARAELRAIVGDWTGLARRVQQPTRIWVGTDDTVHPRSLADALARNVDHAQVTTVQGGFFALTDQLADVLTWATDER